MKRLVATHRQIFIVKITKLKSEDDGIVMIGDSDILSKICKGVFFKVENQGICMLGIKK